MAVYDRGAMPSREGMAPRALLQRCCSTLAILAAIWPYQYIQSGRSTVVCEVIMCKVYWSPTLGEELLCECESGNPVDPYAVTIVKDAAVVGHVAKKNSARVLSFFTTTA